MIEVDIGEARRRAERGPLILVIRRFGLIAVNFLSLSVLSRMLTPEAFGLSTMAAVTLTFGNTIREFGLTKAVMRNAVIDQEEISFVFWLNAAITVMVCALIVLAAPFVATFYGEPVIQWIVMFSALGLLVRGAGMQHRAMLHRELRFGALGTIDVIAAVAALFVAVTVAIIRQDVWAIVAGTTTQMVIEGLLCFVMTKWRPNGFSVPANVKDILAFGFNALVFSMSNFFCNNISLLLIGRYLGAQPLGHFNRAQNLYMIQTSNLIQPITQSALPLLSRLKDSSAEYRAAYIGAVSRISLILMPVAAILCVASVPITLTILGDQWEDAGMVLALLAPSLFLMPIGYPTGDLLYTQDRTKALRTIGIVEAVVRIGLIVPAINYGIAAVAIAFTAGMILTSIYRMVVLGARPPVSVMDQLKATSVGVLPAIAAAAGALLMVQVLPPDDYSKWIVSFAAASVGLGAAFLAILAIRPSRLAFWDLLKNFGLGAVVNRFGLTG